MQPVVIQPLIQPVISFRTALACTLVLVCTLVYLDDPSRLHGGAQTPLAEDDLAIALFCASLDPRHATPSPRHGVGPEREPARATSGGRIVVP